MVNTPADDAFAQYLVQMRTATESQINEALAEQGRLASLGDYVPLAEVLVRSSVITPEIRDNVDQAIGARVPKMNSLGQFTLLKKLGEGGMGAVYLADDTVSGRKVALKVLPKRLSGDENVVTRFQREAKAIAKLNHENIVAGYTAGSEKGYHYFVMEYCDGEPLDKKLKRKGFLPWDRSINITIQTAQGLKHAHHLGIVHRDIKPGNLCILTNGVVKILDMGLSKQMDCGASSFNTKSGVVMGTPHYLSPEQATGTKEIDGRADIYSLGATLYNMVTGDTPFHGASSAVIMLKHVNEQLPNPQDIRDDIPDGVVMVIRKMMAKSPDDRYRDCGELLVDLSLVLQGKMPEIAPLDELKSSIALPKQPHKKGPPTKGAHISPSKRDPTRGYATPRPPDALPPKPKVSPAILYAGVAAAIIVVFLIAYFAFGKSPNPPADPSGLATVTTPTQSIFTTPAQTAGAPTHGVAITAVQPLQSVAPVETDAAAWFKSVQSLPAEDQLKKVIDRLKTLNPGYDGAEKHTITDNTVRELSLSSVALQDLSPLCALTALSTLNCDGVKEGNDIRRNRVTDLSPLENLQLSKLSLRFTDVASLEALKKMRLTELNLSYSMVSDLTPLKDMPLSTFSCALTKVTSLQALQAMRLTTLDCSSCAIENLEPLRGMPLTRLALRGTKVTNLAPLAGMPLAFLDIEGTQPAGLSPLKSLPLKTLYFTPRNDADSAFIQELATLERINDMTSADFAKKSAPVPPPVATVAPTPPPVQPAPPPAELPPPPNSYVSFDLVTACNAEFISAPDHVMDRASNFYDLFNWETNSRLKSLGKKQTGLPDDGRVEIPEAKGNFFQLNLAAPRNAINVTPRSGPQPNAVTFVLPQGQAARYSRLALLHSSAEGNGFVRVTLRYSIGDPAEFVVSTIDWRTAIGINPKEHLAPAISVFHDTYKQLFHMNASLMPADPARPLHSITFAYDSVVTGVVEPRFHAAIFAVSGLPAQANADAPKGVKPLDDVDEAWIKSVQTLPGKEQIKRVIEKLVELNPGYDGLFTWKEELNQVGELAIKGSEIENIAPIRALTRLRKLECCGVAESEKASRPNRLRDLSPLKKLILLTRLNISLSAVDDLAPLKGLAIHDLDISNTLVDDLAALKGMPLKILNCANTSVSALAPVIGSSLERLNISGCPIADLAVLKKIPLKELNFSRTPVASLTALVGMPLENLNFADSKVGLDDMAKLTALPLKVLTASDEFLAAASQTLKQSHTLATVNGMTAAEFRFKYPDVLMQENFDRLDIQRLPQGWSAVEKQSLSIVEKPGHGHVLSISNKNETGGSPSLEFTLDAAKLRGRTLVASVVAYCPSGYTLVNPTDKPFISAYYKLTGNRTIEATPAYLEPGAAHLDWIPLKANCVVPANTLTVVIAVKVQHIPVEVFFDDLKVEILPAQPPPPKK